MSEHAHKIPTKLTEERGKRETNVWACSQQMHWQLEKREGKSHVPEHALKKHQVLFMSMLRHDFPSLFSVAIVFGDS